MSRVPSVEIGPEMLVRRLVHRLGYRFRLHDRRLPGKPDLVFHARHKALFVYGCFWHRHALCPRASMSKTREKFWADKIGQNVERHRRSEDSLRTLGWDVCVIWDCETRDQTALAAKLQAFLGPPELGRTAEAARSD